MSNPTLQSFFNDEHTSKEVIDFVREALIKQGKPSIDKLHGCYYRGNNGCKCAIGHLITDDQYRQDMEGGWLYNIIQDYSKELNIDIAKVTTKKLDVLRKLQKIHDAWPDNVNAAEYLLSRMKHDSI